MNNKVFISSSSADASDARRLADVLRNHGLDTWLAEEKIRLGDQIFESISQAMEEAGVIVLLISPEARASAWCQREWSEALEASWEDPPKRLYPILLGGVEPPAFLLNYQTARINDDTDFESLADSIEQVAIGDPKGRQSETVNAWRYSWKFESGFIHQLSFSPDGTMLITAGNDGTARLWNVPSGRLLFGLRAHGEHRVAVRCVAFSPDGRLAATGGDDGQVRLWDVPTRHILSSLESAPRTVWAVAFSSDAQLIATGGDDAEVCLWDVRTGALRSRLVGHVGAVRSVAFSPDSRLAATAGDDGEVRLWDVTENRLRASFNHQSSTLAIAFSPDTRLMAVAETGIGVSLWDLPSGSLRSKLRSHEGAVQCVAFSPDGQLMATGSSHAAIIWNPVTGAEIAHLYHDGIVGSVSFSPDGLYLAVSDHSTVRGWEIPATLARRRLSQIEAEAYSLRPSREDLQERRELLTESLANERRTLGPDHPAVASTLVNLAVVARELGNPGEAHGLLTSSLTAFPAL